MANRNILICSVEETTREALKKALAASFPLIVVEDAETCLSAFRQQAVISLAFMGTSLLEDEPGLFEEARNLCSSAVIIAVGETEEEELAVNAVSNGATGYIMLPLRKDDVMTLANKAMGALAE